MLVFDDLGVPGKFLITSSLKFQTYEKSSLGSRDIGPRTEVAEVFFIAGWQFFDRDSDQTRKTLSDPRVARCS